MTREFSDTVAETIEPPVPQAPRHHVGYVMIGRPTPAGQRRCHMEASTLGVHQTAEQSGVIQVGDRRLWTKLAEAPALRTAADVLDAMAKVAREPGAMAALLDAWLKVVELRSRPGGPR